MKRIFLLNVLIISMLISGLVRSESDSALVTAGTAIVQGAIGPFKAMTAAAKYLVDSSDKVLDYFRSSAGQAYMNTLSGAERIAFSVGYGLAFAAMTEAMVKRVNPNITKLQLVGLSMAGNLLAPAFGDKK